MTVRTIDTATASATAPASKAAKAVTAAIFALSLLAVAGSAQAQSAGATTPNASPAGVRTEHNLSLVLASQIAAHTVAACSASGYAVTATVVDRAGGVRAVHRADNAGPHTLEASRLKAYTAASAKNSTLAMMEAAQKNPAAANLVHIPGYLLLGGGLPIQLRSEVIGAVGVGGAPGGHLDEQCAMAALAKVQDQIQ